MSGLSNWALNQRIYSVAARSRGGGSTNSTIGDILTNDETGVNDAGDKKITNLSEIESDQLVLSTTSPSHKLTFKRDELKNGENVIGAGLTIELSLGTGIRKFQLSPYGTPILDTNLFSAGLLGTTGNGGVTNYTLGGNLERSGTSLTTKDDLTATSLTLTGTSTNIEGAILEAPEINNPSITGKLTLTGTSTNIEGAILDDPTLTGLQGAGLYSIDSNGNFSKIFLSGLSYSTLTNTLSTSTNNSIVFSPKIDNALEGDIDNTNYWDNDCQYYRDGNILKMKGSLTGALDLLNSTYANSRGYYPSSDWTLTGDEITLLGLNPTSLVGNVFDQHNQEGRPYILKSKTEDPVLPSLQSIGEESYFLYPTKRSLYSENVFFTSTNSTDASYYGKLVFLEIGALSAAARTKYFVGSLFTFDGQEYSILSEESNRGYNGFNADGWETTYITEPTLIFDLEGQQPAYYIDNPENSKTISVQTAPSTPYSYFRQHNFNLYYDYDSSIANQTNQTNFNVRGGQGGIEIVETTTSGSKINLTGSKFEVDGTEYTVGTKIDDLADSASYILRTRYNISPSPIQFTDTAAIKTLSMYQNLVVFEPGSNFTDYTGQLVYGAGNDYNAKHILHPKDHPIPFNVTNTDVPWTSPGNYSIGIFSEGTNLAIWEGVKHLEESTDYSGYILYGEGITPENGYVLTRTNTVERWTPIAYNGEVYGTLSFYTAVRLDGVSWDRVRVRDQEMVNLTTVGNFKRGNVFLSRFSRNGSTIFGVYTEYRLEPTFYGGATSPNEDLKYKITDYSINNTPGTETFEAVANGFDSTYQIETFGGSIELNSSLAVRVFESAIPSNIGNLCMSLPVNKTYTFSAATSASVHTISNSNFNASTLANATDPAISPSEYHNFINVKVNDQYLSRNQYKFEKLSNSDLEITFTDLSLTNFTLELPYIIKNHQYYEPLGQATYEITRNLTNREYPIAGHVFGSRTENTNLLQFMNVLSDGKITPVNNTLQPERQDLIDNYFSRGDKVYFNCEVEIIP